MERSPEPGGGDWAAMAGQNPELTIEIWRGMVALRAGRRAEAQQRLAAAVRGDPGNATAWFWLSQAVTDASQRSDCLARIARLDRDHAVIASAAEQSPTAAPVIASAAKQSPTAASVIASAAKQSPTCFDPTECHHGPINDRWGLLRRCAPRNDKVAVRRCASGNDSVTRGPREPRRAHPQRRRWGVVLVVTVMLLMCAAAPLSPLPQKSANESTLTVSGVVQAREVELAAAYSGSVAEVAVRKGEPVQAGQVLVRLDTDLIDAQIAAAAAAVDVARAVLARARAGARPGQIAAAQAQLTLALDAHLAAAQAITDTAALVQNPQEIQLEIAVKQVQLDAAAHKLAQALAIKDAAAVGKDAFEEGQEALRDAGGPGPTRVRVKVAEGSFSEILALLPPELADQLSPYLVDGVYTLGDFELEVHRPLYTLYRQATVDLYLPFEAHLAPNAWWQAWIGVNAAAAEKEGIEAALGLLAARRAQPQELEAQLHQATTAAAQTAAQVAAAEAQLEGLKAGASEQEIAALEAKVRQAEAGVASLRLQRDDMQIVTPIDGVVTTLVTHPGEVTVRGAALVSVADLSEIWLTVYLPEDQLGRVRLGQEVPVHVDSYPDRTFTGRVGRIADQAAFTPRNVSTPEERVNLVFAVEVTLDNVDRALKPGMPADATFQGGEP